MLHIKIFRLHSIFVLFLSFSVWGQNIDTNQQFTLIDSQHNFLYQFDLKSKKCVRYDGKTGIELGIVKFQNIKLDDIPPVIHINHFQISPVKFLITIQGTGQLYKFDTQSLTFDRIDKTYYRGNNFGAIQFIRKNTLISLGGQGFWRIHNIPTFFNTRTSEWDYYEQINENGPKGISHQFGGYNVKNDQIYSISMPPLYSDNVNIPYPFFMFDFKSKVWKELGQVNMNDPDLKNFYNVQIQWIEPYFFTKDIAQGEFIDPQANKIYRFRSYRNSPFLLATHVYIKKNYLYTFQRTYNQNQFEIKLDSISLDQLKKSSDVIGEFYVPNVWYNKINWQTTIYSFICLIFIVMLTIILKQIKSNRKGEEDIWNNLPEQGEQFLTYLCAQTTYMCTTEKLNEILKCGDKTIESQRQYRSKFIHSINDFFERYFKLANTITRHQSETDKRYVDYQLNPTAVEIINKHFKK